MIVTVKHSGKAYKVNVDVAAPVLTFKQSISKETGVPVERMKVLVKGLLKDDSDLSKLGLKESITVIGAAEPLLAKPEDPTVFLEDLDDTALATGRDPPGLINMGNTCYLNATLQALRTIPQLQRALQESSSNTNEGRLVMAINDLYKRLSQSSVAVSPTALLMQLRRLAPQFAETDQRGQYAQQDADEAWTLLVSALRSGISGDHAPRHFIDDWMALELTKTLSTTDAPDESPSVTTEKALKLECNITINTNFLMSGILDSLDQKVEKSSPTLNRTVIYDSSTRLSRLPSYLAIHLVRFYWRRDIQKKAKIMRKVKFPLQLDALDLVTDELRQKVQPVNVAVKKMLKDRDDRAKQASNNRLRAIDQSERSEEELRKAEQQEVETLMETNQGNEGSNHSAMYELCAMVTHKGASADSGHYIGWARKEGGNVASGDEEWYKFDDDKVSTVPASKILSMDGGGEDSVAYILLYRAVQV